MKISNDWDFLYEPTYVKKDNTMNSESKYHLRGVWGENSFEDHADAVRAAKKESHKQKEDIAIYKIDSVVRFPLDDYKVEKV